MPSFTANCILTVILHIFSKLMQAILSLLLLLQDVWEVISPVTVRRLQEEKPQNVELLYRSALAHIQSVIAAPSPASLEQALTCVRVLTRTLPFLLVRPVFCNYCKR
jgi:High-temperature-induced dauer-formation protein